MQSAESQTPVRKLLYDLYEDILLDEHLTSVMTQRRLALTNTSLSFQIDGEPVEEIQALLALECFEDLLLGIHDIRYFGYSLLQCDFIAGKVDLIPRAHVVPSRTLVVATPYDQSGIDYTQPPYNMICAGIGKSNDLGLLLKAAPLVLMKRGDISDWATFNEIFGQPLRSYTYDPNMPGNKEQLTEAAKAAAGSSFVVMPDGSKVEYVSSYQTASAQTYDMFAKRMDEALSKLIVGQTMTTENGSSKSQGEVHERVADKIGLADRRYVLRYLNGHVRQMLIAQGFPADKGEFKFIEEEARLSKKDRLSMDLDIHTRVGKLKKKYVADEYNVEFVDDSDDEVTTIEERETEQQQEPKPGKKATQAAGLHDQPDDESFNERATRWLENLLGSFR